MSEMIERVARTLCMQLQIDEGFSAESAARAATSNMWKNYRNAARMAIEAMREPTQAMLQALNNCGGDTDAIWPAMIDEALK